MIGAIVRPLSGWIVFGLGGGILIASMLAGLTFELVEHRRFPVGPVHQWVEVDRLMEGEHFELAAQRLRTARAVQRGDAVPGARLVEALWALGDADGLIEAGSDYLRLVPDDVNVRMRLGDALFFQKRDFQGALEQYEEVVRLAPESARAQNNLAGSLFALGRRSEAIVHCREAVRLDPTMTCASAIQ